MSVNKQILLGNVGSVEVKDIGDGKKVANIRLATQRSYKDADGKRPTDWHNLVVYGPLVGVVEQYVEKGRELYVEGETRHRSYEKDGETKYVTEVNVNELSLVGGKGGNAGSDEGQVDKGAKGKKKAAADFNDEDIPFN